MLFSETARVTCQETLILSTFLALCISSLPVLPFILTPYLPTCSHPKKLLFSHSAMTDSLWPHGLQHARLPCPLPSPRACSNSCPLSQWCHPTISSSVVPFSSCLQCFPAPGSFLMSQLFASGDQSIGASASVSVLPMNIQDWFPLGLTGLILQSRGPSRVFSNTTVKKLNSMADSCQCVAKTTTIL